jgi:hypothetical protein
MKLVKTQRSLWLYHSIFASFAFLSLCDLLVKIEVHIHATLPRLWCGMAYSIFARGAVIVREAAKGN